MAAYAISSSSCWLFRESLLKLLFWLCSYGSSECIDLMVLMDGILTKSGSSDLFLMKTMVSLESSSS